jgi:hypothetical protein
MWKNRLLPHEEWPMRKSTFNEEQIIGILRQVDGGMPISKACRRRPRKTA